MRYFPFLIGLAGCFLPDARYTLAGETFSTRVADTYSGWATVVLILICAAWFLWNKKKNMPAPMLVSGITGFYLLGFALFRAWNTFSMYRGVADGGLAKKLHAAAIPGEGVLLLVIAGTWLLWNALRQKNP